MSHASVHNMVDVSNSPWKLQDVRCYLRYFVACLQNFGSDYTPKQRTLELC
jgi:hypothetical protein